MVEKEIDLQNQVLNVLNGLSMDYEIMACDPDFADTAAFCERYGIAPEDSANTIIIASKKPKGQFAACVLLATTRLDVNRAVKRAMGVSKVSFASAEQTMELTGMMIGGVTPPGLPEELPLLIDHQVMSRSAVVIGGGSRSVKIRLSPRALAALPNASIVEGLAH